MARSIPHFSQSQERARATLRPAGCRRSTGNGKPSTTVVTTVMTVTGIHHRAWCPWAAPAAMNAASASPNG